MIEADEPREGAASLLQRASVPRQLLLLTGLAVGVPPWVLSVVRVIGHAGGWVGALLIGVGSRSGVSRAQTAQTGVLLLLAALGCGAPAAQTSAQSFWRALRSGDRHAALVLSTAADVSELDALLEGRKTSAVRFDEPLENDHRARVPTQLDIEGLDAPLSFDTHVVRGSGGWQVDVAATRRALRAAEIAALLDSAAEVMRQGVAAVSEALEDGSREAARVLNESLRDLERDLESNLGGLEPPPSTQTPR